MKGGGAQFAPLGPNTTTIVFTSGGTESDKYGDPSAMEAMPDRDDHRIEGGTSRRPLWSANI